MVHSTARPDYRNLLRGIANFIIFSMLYLASVWVFVINPNCFNGLWINELLWVPIILPIIFQVVIFAIDISNDDKLFFPLMSLLRSIRNRGQENLSRERTYRLVKVFIGLGTLVFFVFCSNMIYNRSFSNDANGYDTFRRVNESYSLGKWEELCKQMIAWPVKKEKKMGSAVFFERFVLLSPMLFHSMEKMNESGKMDEIRLFLSERRKDVQAILRRHLIPESDFFSVVYPSIVSYHPFEESFERFIHFPKSLTRTRLEAFKYLWLYKVVQDLEMAGADISTTIEGSVEHRMIKDALPGFIENFCASEDYSTTRKRKEALAIYPLLVEFCIRDKPGRGSKSRTRPRVDKIYETILSHGLFWYDDPTEKPMYSFFFKDSKNGETECMRVNEGEDGYVDKKDGARIKGCSNKSIYAQMKEKYNGAFSCR